MKYLALNYVLHHNGINIYLTKLGSSWYYFGNNLNNNLKVVAKYKINGIVKDAILAIKYIFNNKIFWKEDYTTILDNLQDNIGNKYSFYLPYQPFKLKYMDISNNCVKNIDKDSIVEIDNNYYLIDNNKIIDYDGTLTSGFFPIISIEYPKNENASTKFSKKKL